MDVDFEKLKAPFDPSLISWRVGATTGDKSKGIALAYIDARDVMERLDDVCGAGGWQIKYSHANGKTIADIGIKIDGEWVWKANGAGDTQVEAEKGAISDAMKRAAVVWGVGRYLYDVQNVWVELEPMGRSYKIKNPNDSRLVGALDKAAKGMRVYGETPQQETPPKLTPEQVRQKQFIVDVKTKIKNAPQPDDVATVIHTNIEKINKLTTAQQKHINDYAAQIKTQLEQPMETE